MNRNDSISDDSIIRLNSVGLSLSTIGDMLGCHTTTVTKRLKALSVEPADTRRAFMQDIWLTLNHKQQDWLVEQLGPDHSIREYIRRLIIMEHRSATKGTPDA